MNEHDKYDVAIIGSGPAGLSAAGHAAELKISHILLEAERQPASTIYKYQKGKHVMAEPAILPLRSPMSFGAGTREKILGAWNDEIKKYNVNIRYQAEMKAITGSKGAFTITLTDGSVILAANIVLAIGLQGNHRKLGAPGEDLQEVQYTLNDPAEFNGETIIVVGAGDAAIENALALAKQNRVIMVNRNDEFTRCKEGNLAAVLEGIKTNQLECRFGTKVERVEKVEAIDSPSLQFICKTPNGSETIACHRIIARLGATPPRKLVESFGVAFPNADPASVPELSAQYESNVAGIYIVGALGGYPLIKQAMNQGYEVVEYILGRNIEPADEPLLRTKFAAYRSVQTVNEGIERIRTNVPLLSSLTALQLREFLLDSEILTPAKNAAIFKKNDYTNTFFSIVEGSALVEIVSKDGTATQVTLKAGQFFGEMGLISGRRRTATIVAGDNCVLIETPRRLMLKLLASVEAVRKTLDQVSLKRAVRQYLQAQISEDEVDFLVEGAIIKKYAANETLFNEGDKADGLYMIRRGSVTVSRAIAGKDVVMSYVAAGNYIGEMALMSDAPRSATVKAAVPTECVMLEAKRFVEVVSRNTSMRGGVDARSMQRMSTNQTMESNADSGNLISFLMQQGLGEATDVLLINQSLCIGCDNCEKACAETHGGTSRLDREAGPTYAEIHVPTSCRHCEHPHCMKDCPPDAIHRSQNGEVYISDACIGCGNCEKNCPYGVIQLAPVTPPKSKPMVLSWLLLGLGDEPGAEAKSYDKNAPKKAVKCDMCKGQKGGAACVRACPTGAALRVSPEKFLDYTA